VEKRKTSEPVAHGTHAAGKSEKWEIRKSGKRAENGMRIEGRDRSPQRSLFGKSGKAKIGKGVSRDEKPRGGKEETGRK